MPEANPLDETITEPQKNPTPAEDQVEQSPETESSTDAPRAKRNSGRTGATTPEGRAKSARNATRHGMCAETLILPSEIEEDWLELRQTWLTNYQNPAEDTLLYTFVLKAAQAEWQRLRAQKEYNFFISYTHNPPMFDWSAEKIKQYELVQRYLTAAERRLQREYRILEHHFKTHHKPTPESKKAEKPEPEPDEIPELLFVNNETGEYMDVHGNEYPPPPDYKSIPIQPGVHLPGHPSYIGPTQPRTNSRR